MADTQIKSLSSGIYPSILSSPTTVQHGRYGDEELEQWHISFYTIVTNYRSEHGVVRPGTTDASTTVKSHRSQIDT
eukprot:scaffold30417_cov173-Skeletonema_dohrnii-CCMP3373.AAC.2